MVTRTLAIHLRHPARQRDKRHFDPFFLFASLFPSVTRGGYQKWRKIRLLSQSLIYKLTDYDDDDDDAACMALF